MTMLISVAVIAFCVLAEMFGRSAARRFVSYSYNSGAAFGSLRDSPALLLNLEIAMNIIVLLMLIFGKMRTGTRIGLSMMLGGAVSNLVERIVWGHVIDWIPVPFLPLKFNLSDAFIGLGAVIVFMMLNSPRR